ncbi:unnamed protein product [Cunninghamella echinulata]
MKQNNQSKMPNNSNKNNLQSPFSVPCVPINTINDLQQEVHMMRQTLGQHMNSMDTRMDNLSFISTSNSMLSSVSASFSTSSTLNQHHSIQIARKKYEGDDRKVPKTKFLEFINDYWKPENREAIINSELFNENDYMKNIYQSIWGTATELMGSYPREKPGNFTWK